MHIKENIFPIVLGLSALFVASISAFFSVMGIGMLFSGAPISAMLMASALEFGKMTATTFLYRYWKRASNWLKTYLAVAVFVLMVITSLGVFGWLTAAYQSSSLQYEITQQQVVVLSEKKAQIQSQIDTSNKRIETLNTLRQDQEKRLSEVLGNAVLARNPTQFRQVQDQNMKLIADTDVGLNKESEKVTKFRDEMSNIDSQITTIKLDSTKTKDVITFQFVSDSIGLDLNSTVKWFILVIIIVFDPLSVCLLLAYNVARGFQLDTKSEQEKKN